MRSECEALVLCVEGCEWGEKQCVVGMYFVVFLSRLQANIFYTDVYRLLELEISLY